MHRKIACIKHSGQGGKYVRTKHPFSIVIQPIYDHNHCSGHLLFQPLLEKYLDLLAIIIMLHLFCLCHPVLAAEVSFCQSGLHEPSWDYPASDIGLWRVYSSNPPTTLLPTGIYLHTSRGDAKVTRLSSGHATLRNTPGEMNRISAENLPVVWQGPRARLSVLFLDPSLIYT